MSHYTRYFGSVDYKNRPKTARGRICNDDGLFAVKIDSPVHRTSVVKLPQISKRYSAELQNFRSKNSVRRESKNLSSSSTTSHESPIEFDHLRSGNCKYASSTLSGPRDKPDKVRSLDNVKLLNRKYSSQESQNVQPPQNSGGTRLSQDSRGNHPPRVSQGSYLSLDSRLFLDSRGSHPSLDSRLPQYIRDTRAPRDSRGNHLPRGSRVSRPLGKQDIRLQDSYPDRDSRVNHSTSGSQFRFSQKLQEVKPEIEYGRRFRDLPNSSGLPVFLCNAKSFRDGQMLNRRRGKIITLPNVKSKVTSSTSNVCFQSEGKLIRRKTNYCSKSSLTRLSSTSLTFASDVPWFQNSKPLKQSSLITLDFDANRYCTRKDFLDRRKRCDSLKEIDESCRLPIIRPSSQKSCRLSEKLSKMISSVSLKEQVKLPKING